MRRFRPARAPTISALVAILVFCSLGFWQVRRHQWRTADLAAKNAEIDRPPVPFAEVLAAPEAHSWRRTQARGRFDVARSLVVGPRVERDQAGVRVITPLRLASSDDGNAPAVVLVDRGFVPELRIDAFLAEDRDAGEVDVVGLARALARTDATPGSGAHRARRLRFEPARPEDVVEVVAGLPYAIAPVLLVAESSSAAAPPDALPRASFPRPESPVDHRAYAFIWFASSAAVLAAWLEHSLRRGRE